MFCCYYNFIQIFIKSFIVSDIMSGDNQFSEIRKKVEAVLFSYGDWISVSEIMSIIGIDSSLMVENSLKELEHKYQQDYPFKIFSNDALKYKMALLSEYENLMCDLICNVEMDKPALKVLSVIAYEQPITKTRLNEILGKSVKLEIEYLFRNKFISYEKKGIGRYYKVTKKFYDYFNLDDDYDFRKNADKNIINLMSYQPLDIEK